MHVSNVSTSKSHSVVNLKTVVSDLLKSRTPFTIHVAHVGCTTAYKHSGFAFTSRMEGSVVNLLKREFAGVLK